MNIDTSLRAWINGMESWPYMKKTRDNNEAEYEFICEYFTPSSRKQWSSAFGEILVKTILERQGHAVWRPKKRNGLIADLETTEAFYEVKTRNWTTSGTAGEKILGAPFKYINFTKYTSKKLYIVLVGYQEYEARHKFKLLENNERKRAVLDLYKQWNIEFIYCSDLLRKLDS